MIKNKISFYKEYKNKLADRSEVTADTKKELDILENIFKENNVKKVLDAGGGEGRIAIPLAGKGYDVSNADSSHSLLEKMKTKTDKVKAIETDLRKLPVNDRQFDSVTYNWHVFCDILGVKGKKQVLSEAHRSLKDNGVIILDLPDRKKGEYKKDGIYINCPGGESVFVGYIPSEEEMQSYLKEAGFQNIQTNKWGTSSGFPKITFIAKKKAGVKTSQDDESL
ncbi:class I SAM-dependent methyltransferase [Patescibacteria group bacterium]|nr:class I SAM-dependent methyltransferase [Patescibacteria group bacterium]MBU4601081.1 class I SAM-dependent methyltransferase [Patescibacteria group bacterium]MCG2698199.1 class I SAM-dependent methyltransferase [Candidatus Parcubacteria bacterium]